MSEWRGYLKWRILSLAAGLVRRIFVSEAFNQTPKRLVVLETAQVDLRGAASAAVEPTSLASLRG
jgi:hypothetical protein